jgi:hypothetical protein
VQDIDGKVEVSINMSGENEEYLKCPSSCKKIKTHKSRNFVHEIGYIIIQNMANVTVIPF